MSPINLLVNQMVANQRLVFSPAFFREVEENSTPQYEAGSGGNRRPFTDGGTAPI